MTDRELLEAAARAYWGDEIDDVCTIRWLEEDQAIGYTHGDNQDHNGQDREFVWNPLTDDGDALKLADQLQLNIVFHCGLVLIGTSKKLLADEASEDYKYAIVRAAIARATHKEQT